MPTRKNEKKGRDPGLTIRVPLETVLKLREIAPKVAKKNPLMTADEVLRRLAIRAVEIGVASGELTV